LESDLLFPLLSDLPDHSLERKFSDQKVGLNKKVKIKEQQQATQKSFCCLKKILTLFWYFLIYLNATVPGLNLWGFLTPETRGADFLAIFWAASCFLGTFWAVDFLAVCFVRAM